MVVTVKYNGEPTDFNAQLQIDYSGSRQHAILARHNRILCLMDPL
jgi:hypothetical protein